MFRVTWAAGTAVVACTGAFLAWPASAAAGSVLSGAREVTITRVLAFESGVSMDAGRLTEVDDDSGRRLFVPTPLRGHKYLIESYGNNDGHPANDDPACWEVYREDAQPLTVFGNACDATNPNQQFTINSLGNQTYAISHNSAYLQYLPNRGLILEELGEGPLLSTFRLNDNGPARTRAGG